MHQMQEHHQDTHVATDGPIHERMPGSCLLYLLKAGQAVEGLSKHQGEPKVGQSWALPSYENLI